MKKKGLIISTVVMVVVLIASLTTATYAWFSAQAQATVDDLAITTKAADGLQIAMVNNDAQGNGFKLDDIYSGELTYEGKWTGTSGWGTYLGFASIDVGELEHAATYFDKTKTIPTFKGYKKAAEVFNAQESYFTFENVTISEIGKTVVSTYFEKNTDTDTFNYTSDVYAKDGKTYYEVKKVATPNSDDIKTYYVMDIGSQLVTEAGYYQPTMYDSDYEPVAYRKITENQKGTFYRLTMAVTNLKQVGALGFSLEVVPSGDATINPATISASNPGMAAATRVIVETRKQNDTTSKTATLAPFSAYKLTNANKLDSGTSFAGGTGFSVETDGALNSSGKYTHVLAGSNVAANSVFFINMTIWVEGTDTECKNVTAGTNMNFYIKFAYSATDGSNGSDIQWNWEDTLVSGTQVSTITLN